MSQQYQGIRSKGLVVTAAALFAAPLASFAAAPTLGDVLGASGVSFGGYLDTSYTYADTDAVAFRVFDTEDNGFNIHQLALTASKLPAEGVGGLVNVTLGQDADVIASAGTDAADDYDLTQAYVQYATGALTVMAGKFVTLSGAEVINTPSNTNLSRSFLFGFAIPFSHTGVRASYKLSDVATVYVGLNNGWDVQTDSNEQKTIELAAAFAPSSTTSVMVAAYSGQELGATGLNGTRTLVDGVASFQVNNQLGIVFNLDWASQDDALGAGADADWSGYAVYGNYKLNDRSRGSLRAELFDDEDGFKTGVAQELKEVTLTYGHALTPSLELLAELRADKSDVKSFVNDGKADDTQNSLGFKAIYKF